MQAAFAPQKGTQSASLAHAKQFPSLAQYSAPPVVVTQNPGCPRSVVQEIPLPPASQLSSPARQLPTSWALHRCLPFLP